MSRRHPGQTDRRVLAFTWESTMSKIVEDPFSCTSVRAALNAWDNLQKLAEHPLANLEIVEEAHRRAYHVNTDTDRGLSLRSVLREAIEEARRGGT